MGRRRQLGPARVLARRVGRYRRRHPRGGGAATGGGGGSLEGVGEWGARGVGRAVGRTGVSERLIRERLAEGGRGGLEEKRGEESGGWFDKAVWLGEFGMSRPSAFLV